MIVVCICGCGRRYTADTWAALHFVGFQPDEPEDLALRNCPKCGSTRAVPRTEDRACHAIAQVNASIRIAMTHARLALAMVRQERANAAADGRDVDERYCGVHFKDAREQRSAARVLRAERGRLEQLIRNMWRKRELADPSAKIGRTLVVIDGGDPRAKTEPPSAGAR